MLRSLTIALLLLLSYSLFSQVQFGMAPPVTIQDGVQIRSSSCVPSPNVDRPFDPSISFEAQVNSAINAENSSFRKSYPNYIHPNYDSNDPQDLVRKVLRAIRAVYASDGISELDITYDQSVIDLAADHNCAMDTDDLLCHNCPSDGTFTSRIVNRIGAGCYSSGSENIAFISTSEMESSILRIIYLMMYSDLACCNNGHRENFLNCNFTENTKLGFEIHRGDIRSSSGQTFGAWFMTWDYVTYRSYPDCGAGCNCGVSIGTPLCGAPGTLLPIELSSFTAAQKSCETIDITWETASEENNEYFILERSFDQSTWEEIKVILGAINSSVTKRYQVEDPITSKFSNVVYYRLRQYDVDGESTESDLISTKINCSEDELKIYPNPANDIIHFSDYESILSVSVYDLEGKKIMTKEGFSTSDFTLQNLSKGLYILKILKRNGEIIKRKLIKAN